MTRTPRASWATRSATVVLAGSAVVGLAAWPSVAAAGSVGAAGAGDPYFPAQGNGGYDVGHYDLALTATDPAGALSGVATITATATQPLSRFDLDLRRDLTVSSVTVDGAPAAFQSQEYKDFNAKRLLAPYEVDGAQVTSEWTAARDRYQALITQYGIPFGEKR